jgi:GT2 family glycosyltransferase
MSRLFEGISHAADRGLHREALRLADSARRYAPDHPTARLIHARSLLRHGDPAGAAKLLESSDDAQSLLVFAEAAIDADLIDAAHDACGRLLKLHAVDSLPALAALAGRVCRHPRSRCAGWMGIDAGLRLVGEVISASAVIIWGESSPVGITVDAGSSSFSVPLPDGFSGSIRAMAGGLELLGSGLAWPVDFGVSGWVVLEDRELSGEVSMGWNSAAPLTVIVAPGRWETRYVVEPAPAEHVGRPFSWRLADRSLNHALLHVEVLLPDGRRYPLSGSPIRQPQFLPRPISPSPWVPRTAKARSTAPALINIVVPVYAGREETMICLRSVLATVPARVATLTVVDDASPDGDLRVELDALAAARRITLVRNPVNLGFPGAVNRGMRLHPERDVVLLNSDTEVFPGWLERLRAAAYREDGIATVTPLGEAAAIVSFGDRHGRPLSPAVAAGVDRVARTVNADTVVDIPVGVGFCLFIRRQCLEEIGEFDEHAFGRGYGEETDFCLRARRHGWRHVAAPNVFVRHMGGRSFGRIKAALSVRNQRVVNHRHPGYDALVGEFIARDPLRIPKRDIDAARLLEGATRPVLLVTLALGGGVKRVVDARRRELEAHGSTALVLRGAAPNSQERQNDVRVEALDLTHLVFDARELEALRALLSAVALTGIEIHHFLGLSGDVLEMLVRLGVPYRVVVHDYTWVCPRVSLLNGAGVYCGEPALEACEACVRDHGSSLGESLSVGALRERSGVLLRGATHVAVPSEDVRTRLSRYFPSLTLDVEPLEPPVVAVQRPRRRRAGPFRVLLLGAINTKKGAAVLHKCALDAVARNLPLEFIVIGYASRETELLETGRVFMTGPYEDHEVPALLDREDCDVALFPTVGPETWCFTLTYALARAMPIVAFDIGAIPERLKAAGTGVLLPWDTNAATVNDELLRVAGEQALVESATDIGSKQNSMAGTSLSETQETFEPTSTVQVLTLPAGLYAFTVESGAAVATGGLMLPALLVSPAPAHGMGCVEFMSGPMTLDRWLTAVGDAVTVKISGGDAALMLTSVRGPDSGVLSIDVKRLDGPARAADAVSTVKTVAPTPSNDTRVVTLVHVPYLGDLTFVEGWAGKPSENLWIEGFSVVLEEPSHPDLVEYCGVSEDGDMSGWMSGGDLCGARGTGVPLVAFAVRIKPDAVPGYTCQYSGRFLSGNVIGPFDDGRFCRSEAPGDPLVALELRIEPDPATLGSRP